jgi:phosphate/sulfate permease
MFINASILLLTVFGLMYLVTGLSNDAVNFLGPAVGSGALRKRNLLFLSSAGILLGSFISAGMMDVAPNEIILTPGFSLTELFSVFTAAMLISIVLVDTYNTLKYPVSTTIVMFFGLTGGALSVVMIRGVEKSQAVLHAAEVINTDKVLFILTGIIVSIFISFFTALIAQFLARLMFSFGYRNRNKILLSVFGGGSITTISFLILKKSLSGSFIFYNALHDVFNGHIPEVLITIFAGSTFIFFFLSLVLDINITRPVVLFGTFALALSFVANDLVNFIGLPLHALSMSGRILFDSHTALLFIFMVSALIMAITLFVSKKSRGVIDTEISLMCQGQGEEHFQEMPAAVYAVRFIYRSKKRLTEKLPDRLLHFISRRYQYVEEGSDKGAYFDDIRAIVHLTIAGLFISLGTYFRFPLSTTFVVFMTGIGAAIADNGWTEYNAAKRLTGVIYIMGGWFLSAVIALAGGFILTPLIFYGKGIALVLLALLLFYRLYKTTYSHKNDMSIETEENTFKNNIMEQLPEDLKKNIKKVILECSKLYFLSVNSFIGEDKKSTSKTFKDSEQLFSGIEEIKSELFESFVEIPTNVSKRNALVQTFDHIVEILKNVEFVTGTLKKGITKKGNMLTGPQLSEIHNLAEDVSSYFNFLIHILKENKFDSIPELIERQQLIISYIEDLRTAQVKRTKNKSGSVKAGLLILEFLAGTKNILLYSVNFINAYRKI